MAEASVLKLQQALAALVLDPEGATFEDDPAAFARSQGLPEKDAQSFQQFNEGLAAYRELARLSLVEPIEIMFPITKALLEREDAWEPCIEAFLQARCVASQHYRDIAPAFLGWLAETGWGQVTWPFLLELAHAEILEVLVARFPETECPSGLHRDPRPEDRLVLDPAAQVVSYRHAVHQVSEAAPIPESRLTHLLAYRDGDGRPQLMDLTPAAATLLVQAQTESLVEAAAALGLPDLVATMTLLEELRDRGAIAGYHGVS
ncbi:HvfC family peptide modification chaperone [Geothrix fuzhouensis]|uniref:HvfC family peptide modification chaperone n=1 Tax=Geothrix fuzhouensis TaxID=2966451 RepID=UPI0021491E3E|nr:putative DNA-binding domain-containing protein [Geothrix fuzhouensis]